MFIPTVRCSYKLQLFFFILLINRTLYTKTYTNFCLYIPNLVDQSILDAFAWLKRFQEPWDEVLDYWRITCDWRLKDFMNSELPVDEYIETYRILKQQDGYKLVSALKILILAMRAIKINVLVKKLE